MTITENVPSELRQRAQWVTWRYEDQKTHKQVTKDTPDATKVPRYAKGYASTTNPETWSDFTTAYQVAQQRKYEGVGYVFSGDDPYTGIDLDDCIDGHGRIKPWAQNIIDTMNSYAEVSPSGKGVKIFVEGNVPSSVKVNGYYDGGIEIYSAARFFTVTGEKLANTPSTIRYVNGELTKLYEDAKAVQEQRRKEAYITTSLDRELATLKSTTEGGRNNQLYTSTRSLKRFVSSGDISESDLREWLHEAGTAIGLSSHEVNRTIDSAFRADVQAFEMPASKDNILNSATVKSTDKVASDVRAEKQSEAIIRSLNELGYVFALNRCGSTIEVNRDIITDFLVARMHTEMRDLSFKNMKAIDEAYISEALKNAYHPIENYLNGLVWDGTHRIDALASHLKSDDAPMVYRDGKSIPLHTLYLYRWLIGAVAKVLDHHQNMMLVLAGAQGIGKSHFVNWLCSGLPDYFIEDKINPDDKDNAIRLMSKFIWEVGELDATTRKADVSALKDFITRKVVTVRRSYGRYDTTGPAIASLIGTVNNNNGFLVDDTGNRRFLVTNITHIDHGYTAIDINQVWAEVVQMYRDGTPWQLLPEEMQRQSEQNKEYEVESILEGQLRLHFYCDAPDDECMTAAEIVAHLLKNDVHVSGNSKAQANEIASACRKVGIAKHRTAHYRGYKGIAPRV